jgi:hypothetical protein
VAQGQSAIVALAGICSVLFPAGCQVRRPGSMETAIVQGFKRNLSVGGKGEINPLPGTPEDSRAGQESFSHDCMVCHGLDGQNTGVPFADRMSPPVPPLNSPIVQRYTDRQTEVGDPPRDLSVGHAGFAGHPEPRADMADRALHPSPTATWQSGRTFRLCPKVSTGESGQVYSDFAASALS